MSISSLSAPSAWKTTASSETVSGGKVMYAAASEAGRAGVLHDNYAAEVLFNVGGAPRLVGRNGRPRGRSLCLRRRFCPSVRLALKAKVLLEKHSAMRLSLPKTMTLKNHLERACPWFVAHICRRASHIAL